MDSLKPNKDKDTADKNSTKNSTADQGMAILVTGATHARELLSSQVPLFLALKLIHQGIVQNNSKY